MASQLQAAQALGNVALAAHTAFLICTTNSNQPQVKRYPTPSTLIKLKSIQSAHQIRVIQSTKRLLDIMGGMMSLDVTYCTTFWCRWAVGKFCRLQPRRTPETRRNRSCGGTSFLRAGRGAADTSPTLIPSNQHPTEKKKD